MPEDLSKYGFVSDEKTVDATHDLSKYGFVPDESLKKKESSAGLSKTTLPDVESSSTVSSEKLSEKKEKSKSPLGSFMSESEKSKSASSLATATPSKGTDTKSTSSIPEDQKDIALRNKKIADSQFTAAKSHFDQTNASYKDLDKRASGFINILNNPVAPGIQKQWAQSQLSEMSSEIQKVTADKKQMDAAYKKAVNDVEFTSKKLKDITASYTSGIEKNIMRGTADIVDAMQGANNFLSKYLFGHEVQGEGFYSKIAHHIRENNADPIGELPDNLAGDIVGGIASSIPLVLATAIAPETAIPKFATALGAISFGKAYQEHPDLQNAIKQGAYGLAEGSIWHGLGVAGKMTGELVAATKAGQVIGENLSSKATAALINATGFGGDDALKQYLQTGKVDWRQVASSAGTGIAFSLGELTKAAYERAVTKTINTDPGSIGQALSVDKSPEQLRDDAASILEKSVGGDDTHKAEGVLAAKALNSTADIKAIAPHIAAEPSKYIVDVNKSDMTVDQKKAASDNIKSIYDNFNPNVQEAKPLRQRLSDLNDEMEVAKTSDDPEFRDMEMARIASNIEETQGEIDKILNKPIDIAHETLKSSEGKAAEGATSRNVPSAQGAGKDTGGHTVGEDAETEKELLTKNKQQNGNINEPNGQELLQPSGKAGEPGTGTNETKEGTEPQVQKPKEEKEIDQQKIAESESYLSNLSGEQMKELAKEVKQFDVFERKEKGKDLFEKNSGIKLTDEQWNEFLNKTTSKSFVVDSEIQSEPLKPKENATKEGIKSENDQLQYKGVETQQLSPEASHSNFPESGKEGKEKEEIKNPQALPDDQYIQKFIDSGMITGKEDIMGNRVNFSDMSRAEIRKGIEDIASGKNSVPAQKLKFNIIKTKQTGQVPFMEGTGGMRQKIDRPLSEFHETINQGKSAPQEEVSSGQETVLHKGELHTVERDESGDISDIKDSKGNSLLERKSIKDFNAVAKIAEVKKTGSTAASKDVIASQRAEAKQPELTEAAYRGWDKTVIKEAKENVASGKVDPSILTDHLIADPNKRITDTDIVTVMGHVIDMNSKYEDVLKNIRESKSGEDITGLIAQQEALKGRITEIQQMLKDKGRQAGQTLASFGIIMKQDMSRLSVQARIKAAVVGGEVTEKIQKEIEGLHNTIEEQVKRISDVEKQLKETSERLADTFKGSDLSKALRRQKVIEEAKSRKAERLQTKEEILAEREEIKAKLSDLAREQRSMLSSTPISLAMVKEMGRLAINYVKAGIVDVAQIVDDIHAHLKDIIPDLTKQDIEDAIAGEITSQSIKEAREFSSETDKGATIEQRQAVLQRNLERSIDDYKKRIASGEINKKKELKTPLNEKLKELIKERDNLKKQYNEVKDAEAKKRLAENKINNTIEEVKKTNRPKFVKRLELLQKAYKAKILSGITTPIKLASAVLNIVALKPGYVGIGNLLSKIPGVSSIYKKAPMQVMGIKDLGKFYSTLASKETFKESYNTLLGKSKFSALHEPSFDNSGILEIPGRTHAAIKVFGKLPEYEASKQSLINDYIKKGEDPFTDEHLSEIETLATTNALNSVLMDDNKVSALWNNLLLSSSKSKSDGVKALSAVLSINDPIVRVPLNQTALIWEHIPVLGMLQRIGEIKRGVATEEGLSLKEANEIARNITRQGMGLVIAGAATMLYKQFGGFQNWRSKQDKEIGIEEMGVKAGEYEIPKLFLHNGAWQVADIFSTIARENEEGEGIVAGIGKAAAGAAEENIPFVRSAEDIAKTTELLKSGKLSQAAGKFVGDFISTTDTRKLAVYVDDHRKTNPQGFWEAVANDIPGLRKYVTGKEDIEFAKKWAKQTGRHASTEKEIKVKQEKEKDKIEKIKRYMEWKKENNLK